MKCFFNFLNVPHKVTVPFWHFHALMSLFVVFIFLPSPLPSLIPLPTLVGLLYPCKWPPSSFMSCEFHCPLCPLCLF